MSNSKKNIAENTDDEKVEEKITTEKETFENAPKKEKSVLHRIWDVVFWCAFIVLVVIWLIDFNHVRNNEEPQFCISTTNHEYEDGNVKECLGLGYKIYSYNRKSMNTALEFGPFWIQIRE